MKHAKVKAKKILKAAKNKAKEIIKSCHPGGGLNYKLKIIARIKLPHCT